MSSLSNLPWTTGVYVEDELEVEAELLTEYEVLEELEAKKNLMRLKREEQPVESRNLMKNFVYAFKHY